MIFEHITSRADFDTYLLNCSDEDLNHFAYECKILLTEGTLPEKARLGELLGLVFHTTLDLVVPIALEYLRRNALPF